MKRDVAFLLAIAVAAVMSYAFMLGTMSKGISSYTDILQLLSYNSSVAPCGEWTPNGDLPNPNYDGRAVTAPVLDGWVACPDSQVGMDYLPDSEQLYCNPDMKEGGRVPAILALDMQFVPNVQPEYSLISPSHCAASALEQTAPTLCQYTTGKWEIIFILDESWDDSLQKLREILISDVCRSNQGLLRARILSQPVSILETSSDNLGLTLADPSHFYIEVQADMLVVEKGWNRDLARPFFQYNDLFSVSGRCGHRLFAHGGLKGRCGAEVEGLDKSLQEDTRDSIIITQTNNRGPLIWRADALQKLKFLDEVNFYMGSDDHDVNRRAMYRGWHAAYKYSSFYSPRKLSPRHNVTLKSGMPEEAKVREMEWKTFRKARQNHQCDPLVPWKEVSPKAPALLGEERRSLLPLPQNLDMNTTLPPLPPLKEEALVPSGN